jgi:hypothetical protein
MFRVMIVISKPLLCPNLGVCLITPKPELVTATIILSLELDRQGAATSILEFLLFVISRATILLVLSTMTARGLIMSNMSDACNDEAM